MAPSSCAHVGSWAPDSGPEYTGTALTCNACQTAGLPVPKVEVCGATACHGGVQVPVMASTIGVSTGDLRQALGLQAEPEAGLVQ